MQTASWPYNFLNSSDYPRAYQRGQVTGRLIVHDVVLGYGKFAFVGLAPPGEPGSWQEENKVRSLIRQYQYFGNLLAKHSHPKISNGPFYVI